MVLRRDIKKVAYYKDVWGGYASYAEQAYLDTTRGVRDLACAGFFHGGPDLRSGHSGSKFQS